MLDAHLLHGITVPCSTFLKMPYISEFLDHAELLGYDCFKPLLCIIMIMMMIIIKLTSNLSIYIKYLENRKQIYISI